MLKLVGSVLIVAASLGFACSIRRELADHLKLLYEIRRLFVDIANEARYSMQPVEVLLGCFIKTKDERLTAVCREIADNLLEKREGAGEEVWRKVFTTNRRELGLKEDEAEVIENAGNAFFGKSMEENQKHLSLYLERLDFMIGNQRREQKEKQRVYQTVSVMCGLMLIILLI